MNNQFLNNPTEIKMWLDKMGISGYTISSNGKVTVTRSVNLRDKELTSIPVQFLSVDGDFDCSKNQLTSLMGVPREVKKSFNCHTNLLTSLQFAPDYVGFNFVCSSNQLLTSLEWVPKTIFGIFHCDGTNITSLVGISDVFKSIGQIFIAPDLIKEGGLGLLLIEDLKSISVSSHKAEQSFKEPFDIIRTYLNRKEDIFKCQEELIENGYEEYTRL